MKLSPNFSLEEFLRSDVAARMGIDMTPTPEIIANLALLCEDLLEPIRAEAKVGLRISSGYRPVKLNRAVGGAKLSDHIDGLAADIVPLDGMTPFQLCQLVEKMAPSLPTLKKVIFEFGAWAHISHRSKGDGPPLFLTAYHRPSGTVYELGLRQDA